MSASTLLQTIFSRCKTVVARRVLLLLGLVALSLQANVSGAQDSAEYRMRTTAASCLRVRTSPDVRAPRVACLELGTPVVALESTGSWRRVRLADNREGWVAKAFLEFAPIRLSAERVPVVGNAVVLAKGPSPLKAALLGAGVTGAILLGPFLLILRGGRAPRLHEPHLRHPATDTGIPDSVQLFRPIEQRLANLQTAASEQSLRLAELSETTMKLQGALDERDQEVRRLKKGYDAEIFRRFLRRFIRVDQALADMSNDRDAGAVDVAQLRKMFQDALDECGVEQFEPEIGADYRTAPGISDNPKVVPAQRPEDTFRIAEVIDPGYRLRGDSKEIVLPARVKIFLSSTE